MRFVFFHRITGFFISALAFLVNTLIQSSNFIFSTTSTFSFAFPSCWGRFPIISQALGGITSSFTNLANQHSSIYIYIYLTKYTLKRTCLKLSTNQHQKGALAWAANMSVSSRTAPPIIDSTWASKVSNIWNLATGDHGRCLILTVHPEGLQLHFKFGNTRKERFAVLWPTVRWTGFFKCIYIYLYYTIIPCYADS